MALIWRIFWRLIGIIIGCTLCVIFTLISMQQVISTKYLSPPVKMLMTSNLEHQIGLISLSTFIHYDSIVYYSVHFATKWNGFISHLLSFEADECNSTKQACPSSDLVTLVMNKYWTELPKLSGRRTCSTAPNVTTSQS